MQGIEIPGADKREDRLARAQKIEAAKLGGLDRFCEAALVSAVHHPSSARTRSGRGRTTSGIPAAVSAPSIAGRLLDRGVVFCEVVASASVTAGVTKLQLQVFMKVAAPHGQLWRLY